MQTKHESAVSLVRYLVDETKILHIDATSICEILQKKYCSVFSKSNVVDVANISDRTLSKQYLTYIGYS